MQDVLREYGADVDGALQRMMNDEDFYAECICGFLEDDAFPLLKQTLDRADYTAAFEYAHALKGVAANLGLTPVYRAVCDITEPLRAKTAADYDGLFRRLERQKIKLAEIMPSDRPNQQ